MKDIAALTGVSQRTIRRDLYALSRVFPITRAAANDWGGLWMLEQMAAWPALETTPVSDFDIRT